MAIDPNVKKKADDIRNKIYGKEVRESLASGLEAMSSDVIENEGRQSVVESRQDSVESQFQDVIENTTDKDVISAPEIIAARDGEANLKARLDKEHQDVTAQLAQKTKFVTYDMFGVDDRPKFFNPINNQYYLDSNFNELYDVDDGILIKQAHEFANEHNLPIMNTSGEYVIRNTREIPIMNATFLGESVFHIDERTDKNRQIFTVKSKHEWTELTAAYVTQVKNEIGKGIKRLKSLSNFENSVVRIRNTQQHMGSRVRNDVVSGPRALEEIIYIDTGGVVIGDVTWDYTDVTNVFVKRADENLLTIDGGTFLLNGLFRDETSGGNYEYSGFYVSRSRVKIKNQFVGLEYNATDLPTNFQDGFYFSHRNYDFTLENIRVTPRGDGTPIGAQGTYGIGGRQVVNFTLDNVKGNGDLPLVGVMGTNEIKNLYIKDSILNRIDVHFHAWNVTVENTKVEIGGFNLSGGGKLIVKNTSVNDRLFLDFRYDYGCIWDGDIIIKDSTHIVTNNLYNVNVLDFNLIVDGDYGKPITFGHKIIVEDFTIDLIKANKDLDHINLLNVGTVKNVNGVPVKLPKLFDFKNVDVINGNTDLKIIELFEPTEYDSYDDSYYNNNYSGGMDTFKDIEPNALWKFENVYSLFNIDNPITYQANSNIYLSDTIRENVTRPKTFIPEIKLIDIDHLQINTTASPSILNIEDSTIHNLKEDGGEMFRTKSLFKNTEFKPNFGSIPTSNAFYGYGTDRTFINCTLHPIKINGVDDLDISLPQYGIVVLRNDIFNVYHRHFGTRLHKKLTNWVTSNHNEVENNLFQALNLTTKNIDNSQTKYVVVETD